MDGEMIENHLPEVDADVICGHKVCQTREAKWMCLQDLYVKFYRPRLYDIGGTYIEDVADYWFTYKTERVGSIFLLHLFVCNFKNRSFTIAVSSSSDLRLNKRDTKAFLSTYLTEYEIKNAKDRSHNYITTYNFSDLDVDMLKNKKLYISVSFPANNSTSVLKTVIDQIKSNHNYGALLTDPVGSDFTIESADGAQFKVHKLLLSAHSEVFKAMLKEETAESQNSYVKLIDVCKEDLASIIEFIYTGTVKLEDCNNFNVLMLADKYNITGLRELMEHCLSQQISEDTTLETLILADLYNCESLKMEVFKCIKKNMSSMKNNIFNEITNVSLLKELCEYLISD